MMNDPVLTDYGLITAGAAAPPGGGLGTLFLMVAMIAIFYFFLIRPQQKRAKEHRALVEGLRRGDTVVTSGGIIGKITKIVSDTEAQVEIAEGVRVRILKHTVSNVLTKSETAVPSAESKS